MSEWRVLLKNLENALSEWPTVLIPLIAGYVQVRIYEWDEESAQRGVGGMAWVKERRNTITSSRIEVDTSWLERRTLRVRSKQSLDCGPRRWAFEIEWYAASLEDYIKIGISAAHNMSFFLCTVCFERKDDVLKVLKFGGCGDIFSEHEIQHYNLDHLKCRIYVTILKEEGQERALFEYSYNTPARSYLGKLPLTNYLEYMYPTVALSSNGSDCSITLLDE